MWTKNKFPFVWLYITFVWLTAAKFYGTQTFHSFHCGWQLLLVTHSDELSTILAKLQKHFTVNTLKSPFLF